jgi:hypothetical protein
MLEVLITATVAVTGLLASAFAWIYKRGRSEQVLSSSIDRNSEATENLAAQVGGLRIILESHTQTLTEHHFRLKALEDREVKVTIK